ncbi:MAG: PilZ domain-containing protein, partial [Candidatus Rokuibacteriota bacterium]
GDTVNLASRLESLTKEYGTSILISEFTYAAVRGQFVARELGDMAELGGVMVRGKKEAVKIYAVLPADARKPRVALTAAATLSAVGAEHVYQAQTRDISETGMSLVGLPADWLNGSTIQIRCEGGALPKPILAEGTIVWRRGDAAGVSFTALDPDSAPAVADYLRHRAPPS